MNISTTLNKLGLSNGEVAAYLAILELGESTISDISKKTQMPRSSCYNAVDSLISAELVNVLQIGARRFYKAGNPDKLLTTLKEKETALNEILPQLKSKHRSISNKPGLYFYEGVSGIKVALNDILAKQFPLLAITSIDDAVKIIGDHFFEFIKKRHEKHIRAKLLTHRSEESLKLKATDDLELRQTKFLPSIFEFKTASFIYGDRVAIMSLSEKNPYSFIIEDTHIAEMHRHLFEVVWNSSYKT